jgi:hypothetical protein
MARAALSGSSRLRAWSWRAAGRGYQTSVVRLAGGVALDGGAHQGGEGCALGLRTGLGGVSDVILDPGCPLRCWHMSIIPRQRPYAEYNALVRSANNDPLVAEAGDNLDPAAERSDIRGHRSEIGPGQVTMLHGGHAAL